MVNIKMRGSILSFQTEISYWGNNSIISYHPHGYNHHHIHNMTNIQIHLHHLDKFRKDISNFGQSIPKTLETSPKVGLFPIYLSHQSQKRNTNRD